MQKINGEDYKQVQGLFWDMEAHLAVLAVLNFATPGEIYVDEARKPHCALMRAHQRFYLAGTPDNTGFNQFLHRLFIDQVYPQAAGQGGYSLYFEDGWAETIETTILAGLDPIPDLREYFRIDEFQPVPIDWPEQVPEGFALTRADNSIIENAELKNLDELLEEMVSERENVAEFLEKSFGIVLIHDNRVAGWCLSEYNLADRCEVGIATTAAYRRRGLATLMGKAFRDLATQEGVSKIGWHCRAMNKASSSTALKLGYQKAKVYPSYFALFDPVLNWAVHGDFLLEQGNYAAALEWLERAIHPGIAPGWAYIDAAGACAGLADFVQAFHYLDQAVNMGFDNRQWLVTNQSLQCLQDLPEWERLLGRLDNK